MIHFSEQLNTLWYVQNFRIALRRAYIINSKTLKKKKKRPFSQPRLIRELCKKTSKVKE